MRKARSVRSLDRAGVQSLIRAIGNHKYEILREALMVATDMFTNPLGAALNVVGRASTFWTEHETRKSAKVQAESSIQQTEKLTEMLEAIKPQSIVAVDGAFNSKPAFMRSFQMAALVAIPITILDVASAIKKLSSGVQRVKEELAEANIAKAQGWATKGFGKHVHRFVKSNMADAKKGEGNGAELHHFFYVWNPDTTWWPVFEEEQAGDPLGPTFGGYHNDLNTICSRMTSDREVLKRTTTFGQSAIFHLLIPTFYPIVIEEPIAFHPRMGELIVTGEIHKGHELIWLNLAMGYGSLSFDSIGLSDLADSATVPLGAIGFIACWSLVAATGIATVVCPPMAPVALAVGDIAGYACVASWFAGAGEMVYQGCKEGTVPKVHILGNPVLCILDAERSQGSHTKLLIATALLAGTAVALSGMRYL